MNIKEKLQQIPTRLEALSARERFAVVAVAVFILYALVDFTILTPSWSAQAQREKEVRQWGVDVSTTTQKLWAEQSYMNGDQSEQARKNALEQSIESSKKALIAEFSANEKGFEDIVDTVKTLLTRHPNIQLNVLKVLSPSPLLDDKNKSEFLTTIPWEYAIEFQIEGQYVDLLRYSKELEKKLSDSRWRNVEVHYDDKKLVTQMTFRISHLILKQEAK